MLCSSQFIDITLIFEMCSFLTNIILFTGNNQIDFEEFVLIMSKSSPADIEEQLRLAFSEFDKDNSGSISADELKIVSNIVPLKCLI